MYKRTDPQQTLFGVETQLSESMRMRLKGCWAELFRGEVLPILLKSEDHFSFLYGKTGRPNFSVARMLGLCFLQELYNLNDQQALDSLGFDIRWHHALDIGDDDAYLSRRSLVEFRRRLAQQDPQMKAVRAVFEKISKTAVKKLGISTTEQRVDSTHIVSNICTRGRLDLFEKTIKLFIKSLDQVGFSRIPKKIRKWHEHEPDGWFGLGPSERKVKLEQLAGYLLKLITIFKNEQQVTAGEPYQLLVRLFKEQCEITQNTNPKADQQVQVRKITQGEILQSPYDPGASYGHKGRGYSAHVTETCNNPGKPEIITDYEVHGAARSDVGKASEILDRLESAGMRPEKLYADGGYPSVPSALKVAQRDVDFITPVNRGPIPEKMMGRDRFKFDENGFAVRCPNKHRPIDHRMLSASNQKGKSLHAIFNGDLCRKCSKLDRCPVRAPNHREPGCAPRSTVGDFRLDITAQLRLRDQMYAHQQTEHWKQLYKIRSGIEATISELKRKHGLGKLRVRRASKVCFAVACKVIACNIKRWAKALMGSGSPLLDYFLLLLGLIEVMEAASTPMRSCFASK